jgi:hypothetical protein
MTAAAVSRRQPGEEGVREDRLVDIADAVPEQTREIASDAAFGQPGKLAFPQASAMFPEAGIG